MNRLPVSTRERRVLLAGCVVIAAAAVAARGLPALRAWQAESVADAAEQVEAADRADQSIRLLGATRDSLRQRRDRLVSYSAALAGAGSPASAAAALAARVSGAASAADVRLGSVQLQVDTSGSATFDRVSVRAGGTGDVRGIVRMLADLERGPPLVAIREWSVTASDPAAPAHQPETLHVEFVAQGIVLDRRAERAP